MRILLPTIRDSGQIGGTSTHLDMLSRGLKELGHEALVLYLGDTVPGVVRKGGIVLPAGALNRVRRGWGMVYAAEVRGRLLAAATARELSRRERAATDTVAAEEDLGSWEVLNAQEVYSVPALRGVADEHGVPLVLTLHGYPLFESLSEGYTTQSAAGRRYLMRAEMRALRLADAIVTVDTRLHQHVLKLVPERAADAVALMNFIDTSAFYPSREGRDELRAKWGIPADRTVLFCPRRLVKKNGVISPSLAMAAMTPEERRRFLLLHAGDGGEREAIEAIVREQGLEDQVRLLGGQGRDAVLELYRLCDIVLVPSIHSESVEEATSLAALEAMASGRPLIAGAVGGLAEMVDDGVTGLLVPGGDTGALAAAILRLAAAPDLGDRLAENARRYVVANHSHLQAAASYVQVYELAGARARVRLEDLDEQGWGSFDRVQAASCAVSSDVTPSTAAGGPPASFDSVSVLGLPVHVVTLDQAAAWVLACARPEPARPGGEMSDAAPQVPARLVVSFNPELVMRAQKSPAAADALLGADLRYPDGVGAVWAASRQGAAGLERVPGIELAEKVLDAAAREGLGVYFLGAAEGVAEEAAAAMQERLPGLLVCGAHHGYFPTGPEEQAAVAAAVRESAAAILLVAMGAPWQEIFMFQHRFELGVAVALGVGGSFDVWAGRVARAPEWTQRAKVEWLYRLARDPRRVRRQLALPRFVAKVLAGTPDDYGPGRAPRLTAEPPDEPPRG